MIVDVRISSLQIAPPSRCIEYSASRARRPLCHSDRVGRVRRSSARTRELGRSSGVLESGKWRRREHTILALATLNEKPTTRTEKESPGVDARRDICAIERTSRRIGAARVDVWCFLIEAK